MTDESIRAFGDAVAQLHRRKDAAYRSAWKKRGELMSVLANIARKVDRLENIANGAPATPDESLLDTAVDLFVYLLKYEAYLADQSRQAAEALFDDTTPQPYSDGVAAVEQLLGRLDLSSLASSTGPTLQAAAERTVEAFNRIEECVNATPIAPAVERLSCAQGTVEMTVELIGVIRRADARTFDRFVAEHLAAHDAS